MRETYIQILLWVGFIGLLVLFMWVLMLVIA